MKTTNALSQKSLWTLAGEAEMNDWIATLFWVVGLGVVFLTAVNLVLLRLVNKLWRENEELQPPF